MNNSSTSCAASAGPPRDPYYPIDSTHIDIGCVACGKFLKLYNGTRKLREEIRLHKKESPQCFETSTINDNFAECARAMEELVRRNQSLFNRNRSGDVDAFLEKDDILGFQCSRCNKHRLCCFHATMAAREHNSQRSRSLRSASQT